MAGNLGMLVLFASLIAWDELERAPRGLVWPALIAMLLGGGVAVVLEGRSRRRGLERWGLTLAGVASLLALPVVLILV